MAISIDTCNQGEGDADSSSINISGLTEDNMFSSPDGLFIDHCGGI